jgi:hypothetical protein
MMKEQIRNKNRMMIAIAAIVLSLGSVAGIIEQCSDMYPQYPYFFMLPIYLGKAELHN